MKPKSIEGSLDITRKKNKFELRLSFYSAQENGKRIGRDRK